MLKTFEESKKFFENKVKKIFDNFEALPKRKESVPTKLGHVKGLSKVFEKRALIRPCVEVVKSPQQYRRHLASEEFISAEKNENQFNLPSSSNSKDTCSTSVYTQNDMEYKGPSTYVSASDFSSEESNEDDFSSSDEEEFVFLSLPGINYSQSTSGITKDKSNNNSFSNFNYTCWKETNEVQNSGVLSHLTEKQIKRQEGLFEIFSSELRYLNNLKIIERHYMRIISQLMNVDDDSGVITKKEFKYIFGNISEVIELSTMLVEKFGEVLREEVYLDRILDIMKSSELTVRSTYSRFVKKYPDMEEQYQETMKKKELFKILIGNCSGHPHSEGKSLPELLQLPIARIMKYHLPLQAVLKETDHPEEIRFVEDIIKIYKEIPDKCNVEFERRKQWEEMFSLDKKFIFSRNVLPIEIVTNRKLIHRENIKVHIIKRQKHLQEENQILFLFTDLLIVAKQDSRVTEENYTILDYCQRHNVVLETEHKKSITEMFPNAHLLTLILMSNHKNIRRELLFTFPTSCHCCKWMRMLDDVTSQQKLQSCPLSAQESFYCYKSGTNAKHTTKDGGHNENLIEKTKQQVLKGLHGSYWTKQSKLVLSSNDILNTSL